MICKAVKFFALMVALTTCSFISSGFAADSAESSVPSTFEVSPKHSAYMTDGAEILKISISPSGDSATVNVKGKDGSAKTFLLKPLIPNTQNSKLISVATPRTVKAGERQSTLGGVGLSAPMGTNDPSYFNSNGEIKALVTPLPESGGCQYKSDCLPNQDCVANCYDLQFCVPFTNICTEPIHYCLASFCRDNGDNLPL